jgi:hypothetical protein
MTQAAIIVDLYKDEEEMEEAEVARFVEKWVSDMLPRLQHLQCNIQSGNLPLGTLLAAQKEIFEGLSLFFCGLPPDHKYVMIERVAPGWAELLDLMERNRVLAKKLAKRTAAHG